MTLSFRLAWILTFAGCLREECEELDLSAPGLACEPVQACCPWVGDHIQGSCFRVTEAGDVYDCDGTDCEHADAVVTFDECRELPVEAEADCIPAPGSVNRGACP